MHNNPYSNHNNPYSSQGSPWQNNNSQHDFNNQKKLDDDRKKQEYKRAAEEALDRIVRDYENALQNNLKNWRLDPADKATVVRYSKRYWDNQFMSFALFVLIITCVLSFYTPYAIVGIFSVFILREIFSQKVLLTYLLNDHELTRKQIEVIKDKIFFKQLKTLTTLTVAIVLMLLAYVAYMFTNTLFLTPYLQFHETHLAIQWLSKIAPFHVENELFAYVNIGSIMIMMLLKIYEKWSK